MIQMEVFSTAILLCSSMSFFPFGRKEKGTVRPKKRSDDGKQAEILKHKRATATLGSTQLAPAVKLPEGEDPKEWIAINILDFFNQISMLYGTITEHCTPQRCPVMNAGPKYEYHWADGESVKKPLKVSAPEYTDYLLTWAQAMLDDEEVFPSKIGTPFPPNFLHVASAIMKRLFRIYAHIYYQHFAPIEELAEEPHLNTSFKHFILFTHEFSLIPPKELLPLQELINKLIRQDPSLPS